jgi:hypothetical protein
LRRLVGVADFLVAAFAAVAVVEVADFLMTAILGLAAGVGSSLDEATTISVPGAGITVVSSSEFHRTRIIDPVTAATTPSRSELMRQANSVAHLHHGSTAHRSIDNE